MKKFDDLYYLDETDKQILKALTDNARATLTEIAGQTDRSRVAVHRRTKDMKEAGVITGYTVLVDWNKVGNR